MPVQDKNHKTIELGDEVAVFLRVTSTDTVSETLVGEAIHGAAAESKAGWLIEANSVIIQRKAKKDAPVPAVPVVTDDADPATRSVPT